MQPWPLCPQSTQSSLVTSMPTQGVLVVHSLLRVSTNKEEFCHSTYSSSNGVPAQTGPPVPVGTSSWHTFVSPTSPLLIHLRVRPTPLYLQSTTSCVTRASFQDFNPPTPYRNTPLNTSDHLPVVASIKLYCSQPLP